MVRLLLSLRGMSIHTYIFNLSEDVWPFISALPTPARQAEIQENVWLSDREFLGLRAEYAGQDVQMLTPHQPPSEFYEYLESVIPGKTKFIVPQTHSGQISLDALNDEIVLSQLAKSDTISAYCPSTALYELMSDLDKRGGVQELIDVPSASSWQTVSAFSSKNGFRQLIESLNMPGLTLSPGQVFNDFEAAVEAAAARPAGRGVVLKTEKGHSGMGVSIFTPNQLSDDISIRTQQIRDQLLAENGFWSKFPIVVEDYIVTDPSIGGGVPNVEGYVDAQGKARVNYFCGMRVLPSGTFAGVEISSDIFSPPVKEKFMQIGETVGQIYAEHGYRGYYDVDMMAGQDGLLYLTESNIRRTGGTYAYHTARHFYGSDFADHHYILTNMLNLSPGEHTWSAIIEKNKDLFYKSGGEVGLIPTSPSLLSQGQFGYMVLAENRQQAYQIEADFQQNLENEQIYQKSSA